MFPAKPLIGAPVHSLWFAPIATFQNATGPAHFVADTICSPRRAIPRLFSLRRVGQPVAMTAREDCATVEDSNAATAPTGRAEEPMSLTAHVAGRCIEIDRIFFGLPFAAMIPLEILQDNAVQSGSDLTLIEPVTSPPRDQVMRRLTPEARTRLLFCLEHWCGVDDLRVHQEDPRRMTRRLGVCRAVGGMRCANVPPALMLLPAPKDRGSRLCIAPQPISSVARLGKQFVLREIGQRAGLRCHDGKAMTTGR